MRVMVLWKQLSSHTAACFRALDEAGATVRILHRAATPNAPFNDAHLTRGLSAEGWEEEIDAQHVDEELAAFAPDVILICSWDVGAYRIAARRWRGRALRVLCMDNAWLRTPKQWAGRVIAPWVIQRSYDVAFLPGERQAEFAIRLGFSDRDILWGLYCCDDMFFASEDTTSAKGFIYVGRLIPEKAIDTLAQAYEMYREASDEPWSLTIAGTGPLSPMLESRPGVTLHDFVPPERLPALFRSAGCFVLPSRFEPWGVVVHEATASGLPVVCTTACGASTRLVLDGYNGRVVSPGSAAALGEAMRWVAGLGTEDRAAMSQASRQLAQQFTTQRWARYLLQRTAELRAVHVSA